MDDLFSDTPKTLRDNRYEVFEKVGSGGIATVYRGRDQVTGDEVAIKLFEAPILEKELDVVSRFKAEGRAMSQLEHARLVRVVDGAKEQGYYWFAMEYCQRGSLRENVPETGVDEMTALDWTFQLIEGLGYIHGNGMVHRDIKPGNVLLDADGNIKIADFGLARHPTGTVAFHTATGSGLGSVGYRPPEMSVDASKVSPAADLFSAAATLYFMVTGQRPVRLAYAQAMPELLDGIHPQLVPIIMKASAILPEDRYRTTRAMAEAVAFAGEVIAATSGKKPVYGEWIGRYDRLLSGRDPTPMPVGARWLGSLLPWNRRR